MPHITERREAAACRARRRIPPVTRRIHGPPRSRSGAGRADSRPPRSRDSPEGGHRANEFERRYRRQVEQIQQRYRGQWQSLGDEWQAGLVRFSRWPIASGRANARQPAAIGWSNSTVLSTAVGSPPAACRQPFASARSASRWTQIPHGVPTEGRIGRPRPVGLSRCRRWSPFPDRTSMVFEARGPARQTAIDAMQAAMLRLLVSIPPGKLRFTIIDPVGLGENFAAFMHLADYNEALVTSRIWTEPRHIEQRLADLSEHMENVIQKYLRNEFESIEAIQSRGGRDRRAVSLPGRGQLSSQFHRSGPAAAAVDRRQRSALRRLRAARWPTRSCRWPRACRWLSSSSTPRRFNGPRRTIPLEARRVRPLSVDARRAAAAG